MSGDDDKATNRDSTSPALGSEKRSGDPPRAGTGDGIPARDPEMAAQPVRRRISAAYRLRILEEADRCDQPGEIGKLLRREGLSSSQLSTWRKARKQGALQGLTPKKPGVKAARSNPDLARILDLEEEQARLRKQLKAVHAKLDTAQTIIDAQKKVSKLLGLSPGKGKSS